MSNGDKIKVKSTKTIKTFPEFVNELSSSWSGGKSITVSDEFLKTMESWCAKIRFASAAKEMEELGNG